MRAVFLLTVIAGAAQAAPAPTLDSLWADLASSDEARATRAAIRLTGMGKEAVTFLGRELRPVKVDAKQAAKWIEELDADGFEEREAASEELGYLGKHARPLIEKALEAKVMPEVKKRLQALLARIKADEPLKEEDTAPPRGPVSMSTINGKTTLRIGGKVIDLKPRVITRPGPLPSWQRAARAAAVLESIGTPEARKVLEKLAGGEDDALPTRAAKEALKRLDG